jgi:hypothetical protein
MNVVLETTAPLDYLQLRSVLIFQARPHRQSERERESDRARQTTVARASTRMCVFIIVSAPLCVSVCVGMCLANSLVCYCCCCVCVCS